MLQGSCLCGTVRFEIDESKIVLFNYCHCKRCQKRSGTAHTSQLQVAGSGFYWIQGEGDISHYRNAEDVRSSFCSKCGCRLPSSRNWEEIVAIPAGLLDEDLDLVPEISIHVENSPQWHSLDQRVTMIEGQGLPDFWKEFMEEKGRDA